MSQSLLERGLLELGGTALFAIAGTRLLSGSGLGSLDQALTIGLVLALLIHLIGSRSGAHLNPCVTLTLHAKAWLREPERGGSLLRDTLVYVSAQVLGVLLAYQLEPPLLPVLQVGSRGLVSELVFTMLLLVVILNWSTETLLCPSARPLTGFVIGLSVTALAWLGGVDGAGLFNAAIAIGWISHGTSAALPLLGVEMIATSLIVFTLVQRSRPRSRQR
jgi:glycerol uptake facilitator-like aquaporin